MEPAARFRVNSQGIVHEMIDGEVVAINLDTGSYYGTDEVGAAIWQLLAGGATLGDVTAAALQHFAGNPAEIEHGVAEFVQRLVTEALIVPDEDGTAVATPSVPTLGPTPFRLPRLDRYDDMRDLLLADPIHEVEPSGWPRRRTAKLGK
jgi:coenzyme PQQ synthesis protein D (PqqD)